MQFIADIALALISAQRIDTLVFTAVVRARALVELLEIRGRESSLLHRPVRHELDEELVPRGVHLGGRVHAAEQADHRCVRAVAVVHGHEVVEAAVVVLHLEGLEHEGDLEVLRRRQPPDALLVGQVVVGEVRGLEVARGVDEHVAAADRLVHGGEAQVRRLLGGRHVGEEQPAPRRRDHVRRLLAAETTEERRAVPVAVADLEVVVLAVLRLGQVQLRDVEHDALAVRGRDAPLAAVAARRASGPQSPRRLDQPRVLLVGAAAAHALVQQVGLRDVTLAEADALSDLVLPLAADRVDGVDGVQVGALGEGVARVVHDGVVVIRQPQGVDLLAGQLVEVVFLAGQDVVSHDLHVAVAVRAGVLVPEAHHVAQLVHHDAEFVAVLADGDGLGSVAALPDEGAAAAGPLREQDEVGVLLGDALYELDARRVLPVAHGLLEERLEGAAEHVVDLVGDDSVVPDALLAGGGGARRSVAGRVAAAYGLQLRL